MKVAELIAMLEDYPEDTTVLIVHQPGWPLRERVGGVYDPNDESAELECHNCGCYRVRSDIRAMFPPGDGGVENVEGVDLCCDDPEYTGEGEDNDDDPVIYLVANGHPHEGTPYGPRAAWDEMRTA